MRLAVCITAEHACWSYPRPGLPGDIWSASGLAPHTPEVGWGQPSLLLSSRARARATAVRILPDAEASPLSGILLEVETGIPEGVKDAYSTTGTTHAIAISGSHSAQNR